MKESPALEVRNLSMYYDSTPVLHQVNFHIPTGCLAAIVGPNGAGKSTLIQCILGLIPHYQGEIFCKKKHRHSIAYVPQTESIDWDFPATVLDVVMMGRYSQLGWFQFPGKKEATLAKNALARVGMEAYSKRQINQLSGGQKQRVFLARALVQEADLYLMDEPFKGVDASTETSILALLQELKKQGSTVIVVHHDLKTVEQYFDWVCFLAGEVKANGKKEDVFTQENLLQTFGSPLWDI